MVPFAIILSETSVPCLNILNSHRRNLSVVDAEPDHHNATPNVDHVRFLSHTIRMHSYAWIAHTKLQHDEIEVIDGFSNFGSLILFMDPLIIKLGVLTQPEKQVFMCMILNL
jgi:hypothetical protein